MFRIRSLIKIITNYLYYFFKLFVKTFWTTYIQWPNFDPVQWPMKDFAHPEETLYTYIRNNIVLVRRKPAPPIFFSTSPHTVWVHALKWFVIFFSVLLSKKVVSTLSVFLYLWKTSWICTIHIMRQCLEVLKYVFLLIIINKLHFHFTFPCSLRQPVNILSTTILVSK